VEAALWRRLRGDSDTQSRDRLFAQYQDLAMSLAGRRARMLGADRATRSDLQQAGLQGLMEAINRFDPARNVPFAAYARRRINGAISDMLASMTERNAIGAQASRRLRERQRSIIDRNEHRPASPIEELTDIAVQLALSLLMEGQELSGEGQVIVHDNAFDSLAWRQLSGHLASAITLLPDKERTVIVSHYHHDLLFADIAAQMGISKGRVSQLHKSALERLAKKIGRL
jgi:RNA polymerase sigma factor for flagellar operon FliA